MWQYAIKITLTVAIVVAVSEIAKRSSFWAAVLASLPFTSLLAFVWLYADTGNTQKVVALSHGIFWLVIPSLLLFVLFPLFLRAGWSFWLSLGISSAATTVAYFGMVWLLGRLGINV